MKPDKHPLPWCDELDTPYYRVNLLLIRKVRGWSKQQAHKPMSEIIPWIDLLIEHGFFNENI